MDRALALACRGEALASPNPQVGAVLVRNGRVVGEGFHTYDGIKHAEIRAIEKAGPRARGATLYINLEPCCHHGRTGPCTCALIAAGVRRVVAAMRDPNPAVAGRGFRHLRAAGIKVDVGLHEDEARRLNEAFARWAAARVPFVTLKTAMSNDGAIAWPKSARTRRSRWITSRESRAEVQRLRHASDAIVTGVGTILADDPLLTDRSRLPRRRPLLRVILDSRLRISPWARLVRSAANDVLIFTAASIESEKARTLQHAGIELIHIPRRASGLDIRTVLRELARRDILSVLIEAGTRVNSSALLARAADKLIMFVAPITIGRGGKPWATKRAARCAQKISGVEQRRFGPDESFTGYLRDVYRNH
jgi:diaminohydroxyphosphoribosylaminopyrimidine deaminase / 5-amino-6-(5-phosphoribosylamino)uracil reductase